MEIWKESLRFVREAINNDDMDWLQVGIGRERTGKSTLAWHTCKEIDPTFNADRVAFNNEEMEMLIRTCKPGQAILYDEGQKGLYSREASTRKNRVFNKTMMKSAGLNLFIYVNSPSFLSLDWYIRKHRCMSLTKTIWIPFNTKSIEDPKKMRITLIRGIFEFYDASKLDKIYKDQKTNQIMYPKPTYIDTFPRVDPIDADWREYLKKKEIYMRSDENEEYDKERKAKKKKKKEEEAESDEA